MQEPQIVEVPEFTVVGCEAAFRHALSAETNNFKVIPPLWERFLHRVKEIPNRAAAEMYGILYERPQSERTHPDEMQYIASVGVLSPGEVPPGMVSRTIPETTFAVFIHRGPIRDIGATCREIYREWLPQSGFEHSGIADVEVYGEKFKGNDPESEMEYWISVRPRP